MSRVTTKTGIANLAASFLKTEAVSNIDPPESGSKFARLANRWYDEARRQTLADHIWNFAIKRVRVSKDTDDPVFGYGARFVLPADYIRVATIGDEDVPETDYKVEDGYILGDMSSPIDLRYVYDQTDITKYSPMFVTLMARKLAALMAYDMTGSRTFQREKEEEYAAYMSEARSIDAQESPPTVRIRKSRWKDAKEGRNINNSLYSGRVVT